jgi:hypothetical protein
MKTLMRTLARYARALIARRGAVMARLGFSRAQLAAVTRERDALRAELAAVGLELQAARRHAIERDLERDKLLHSVERLIDGEARLVERDTGR